EILAGGGVPAVIAFARTVEYPNEVGIALSATDAADEGAERLLGHLLAADDRRDANFARGFAYESVRRRGREWAERVLTEEGQLWRPAQRAELLACLPYDE